MRILPGPIDRQIQRAYTSGDTMKNWQETATIYARLAEIVSQESEAAVATIISIVGSTYRRPGARLLVDAKGTFTGNVSGGCLEEDIALQGKQVLEAGRSRTVEYDTSDREDKVWGLGLGCNGKVELLIEPWDASRSREEIDLVLQLLQGDQPFTMSTVLDGDGRITGRLIDGTKPHDSWFQGEGRDRLEEGAAAATAAGTWVLEEVEGGRIFSEVLQPPPWLVVCGAGDDSIPLVRMAMDMGFRVVVLDHRSSYADVARFPGAHQVICARAEDAPAEIPSSSKTFVLVKTHSLFHDTAWLRHFAHTEAPYLGLLGPRDRKAELAGQVDAAARERIYGPVGLDLGGEGPEQVALSILSEIMAVYAGRSPGHLRDRDTPIH